MAILEIKKYPDPVLRKKCEEVKEITEEIKKLSRDMVDAMSKGKGIGLAASQVGELKRIIAIQTRKGPEVFINPIVINKSKEIIIEEEGCLSFPGIFFKVKRAKEIELEAINLEGGKISLKAEDLMAIVFQHEIDHLNGILFIDRIPFWQRIKIRNKIKIK